MTERARMFPVTNFFTTVCRNGHINCNNKNEKKKSFENLFYCDVKQRFPTFFFSQDNKNWSASRRF